MIHKNYRLTSDGIAELKAELASLISNRSELAEKIRIAREFGDLAENAEYQTARSDQEKNENRIGEVEHILANAQLITKPKGDSKVQLGSTVILKSDGGKDKQFQVVGTVEADPLEGKISDESPIGQALLGKKEGESVEIKTPAETSVYQIVDIL